MSQVLERTNDQTTSVDVILRALLTYDEVIGAVAVNNEGIVLGSVGMIDSDVDIISLLGASMMGVAERTTRRLGAGGALGVSIRTNAGMITICNGGDFVLMVFTSVCDSSALYAALEGPVADVGAIIHLT